MGRVSSTCYCAASCPLCHNTEYMSANTIDRRARGISPCVCVCVCIWVCLSRASIVTMYRHKVRQQVVKRRLVWCWMRMNAPPLGFNDFSVFALSRRRPVSKTEIYKCLLHKSTSCCLFPRKLENLFWTLPLWSSSLFCVGCGSPAVGTQVTLSWTT